MPQEVLECLCTKALDSLLDLLSLRPSNNWPKIDGYGLNWLLFYLEIIIPPWTCEGLVSMLSVKVEIRHDSGIQFPAIAWQSSFLLICNHTFIVPFGFWCVVNTSINNKFKSFDLTWQKCTNYCKTMSKLTFSVLLLTIYNKTFHYTKQNKSWYRWVFGQGTIQAKIFVNLLKS